MDKYLSIHGCRSICFVSIVWAELRSSEKKLAYPGSQSHLLRPESAPLLHVLQVVSDDVGLLEEQTHRVGQLGVLPHLRVLQLRGGEQLRQTDPYQPCHIVTILPGIKQ